MFKKKFVKHLEEYLRKNLNIKRLKYKRLCQQKI